MFLGDKELKPYLGSTEIKGVYLGDKEIWVNAKPFYWIKDKVVQDGFPSTYATCTVGYNYWNYSKTLTGAYVYGHESGNTQMTCETIAVPTGGNKNVEVILRIGKSGNGGVLDSLKIGGVECKSNFSGNYNESITITVDVSALTEITIKLVMTAWAWGNQISCHIDSIRFYS